MIVPASPLALPPEAGAEILSRDAFTAAWATDEAGDLHRPRPVEVLTPFEPLPAGDLLFNRTLMEPVEVFAVGLRNAVLAGERAFVTHPVHYLITDSTHSSHRVDVLAEAERRRFEGVHLEAVPGGYLYDSTAHPHIEIGGEVVCLSTMEQGNYGAFLLRVLPKLILTRQLGLGQLPVIVENFAPWQRSVLATFGVGPEQTICFDRRVTYQFARVIVPSLRLPEFFLDDASRAFFADTAARVRASNPGTARHERIYVSRRSRGKLRPDYRRFTNEDQLIERLEARGFFIFEPENHSFEEQIGVFAGARAVVGPGGAGMFNVVFCEPGATVVSLEPKMDWLTAHANIFASMGHRYAMVVGGTDPTDPTVQQRWRTDVDVVTALVDRLLDG